MFLLVILVIKIRIHIDISGQITQKNYDSAIGILREDGFEYSVFLRAKDKKDIIRKYKGQVTRLVEKLHCIMIYYALKENLKDANELIICRDINFRKLKSLLHLLFKNNELKHISVTQRDSEGEQSLAHYVALKAFRDRKRSNLLVTKDMIEELLFEFK
jgi:hypothetical protein